MHNGNNTALNFFQALLQLPTPMAIVGAASVEDTKLIAGIGQYFNLNMVSASKDRTYRVHECMFLFSVQYILIGCGKISMLVGIVTDR